jgi:exonuclease VII small subunit
VAEPTPSPLPAELIEEVAFQDRVQPWLMACFGAMIAGDREERNHRFLEEALELVQSCGCTAHEAHQLVDYVYGRPEGEPPQEVGGVMVTLAALCLANGMDMHKAGETELTRIWTKVEAIRAKQAAKPKHSPLPAALSHKKEDGQ